MTTPPSDTYDVFLSHAHTEADVVEVLATRLADKPNNFRVWLDKWVLIPSELWQQAMARSLEQAKTCAICIGQQTPKSWFREEVERALNRQTKDASFRGIPVILPGGGPALVDDFLELRTWVDCRNGLQDGYALHLLVSGVKAVPPGRNLQVDDSTDDSLKLVREQLERIRTLRIEQLIDDDIALEYQRRLLDRLIKL